MVDAPAAPLLLDPQEPLGAPLRAALDERIRSFLDRQATELGGLQPEIEPLLALTSRLLAGGKRMRPVFCIWGYVAAAGLEEHRPGDLAAVLTASASLELLHASALVHDDVMDSSDTRRGAPAAHRQFATLHALDERLGDPESYGRAGAILLGDLLVMWSVEMLE